MHHAENKQHKRPVVAFLYDTATRYSVNALAGALEAEGLDPHIELVLRPRLEVLGKYIREQINSGRPVLLPLSFTSARRPEIVQWLQSIREIAACPLLAVVAGGPDPTAFPELSLESGADAVALGEGEKTFPELTRRWLNGDDWADAQGVVSLDAKGQVRQNPRPPRVSLDHYPPFPLERDICGAIELTRGCPHVCSFCQVPSLHGTAVRHRGVEMIERSIDSMLRTDRQDYRFVTPDAFAYGSPDSREVCLEALEELLARVREKIGPRRRIYLGSFPSEVRPEHVTAEAVELIRRYCNNDNLVLGAQSGSNRLLEACHRGHTIEDVYRAVDIIARAGFTSNVDFIFGLPGETDRDVEHTMKAMETLIEKGARIHTHTFLPLPQTRFSGRRGGSIDQRLRRHLEAILLPRGQAYGNWREQEKLGRRLNRDQGRQR